MVLMRSPEMLERARQMRGHGMTRRVATAPVGADAPLRRDDAWLQLSDGRDSGGAWSRAAGAARSVQRAPCRPGGALSRTGWSDAARLREGLVVPTAAQRRRPITSCRCSCRRRRPRRGRGQMHDAGGSRPPSTIRRFIMLSYYRKRGPSIRLPLTEEFHRRELTLPLHPKMEDADVQRVVQALESALETSWEALRWFSAFSIRARARAPALFRSRGGLRRACHTRPADADRSRLRSCSNSGSPVFFVQTRIGRGGRTFPDVQVPQVLDARRDDRLPADAEKRPAHDPGRPLARRRPSSTSCRSSSISFGGTWPLSGRARRASPLPTASQARDAGA